MFLKLLIFVFLLLYAVAGKPREIKCPDYCKCDVIETLRRATCQNKKLYSVEIDIPPQAEVLDLSYNQISELGSHIFLEIGLTNLKLLNLSHNKVGQIHLNGFEGLTKLKTLDLSFNMLRYFIDQWFVSLSSLQELYLKGNNLKSINVEPRLSLKHLRVLDLSNCAINNLQPGIFQKLPNLEILDISENYLINLDVQVVTSLPKLNTLIVNDNNFECKDIRMAQVKNFTRTKGVSYKDPCQKTKKQKISEQFERMMAVEPQVSEKNVWIYDEEDDNLKNVKFVEVCGNNSQTRNFYFDTGIDRVLMEVIELSPVITILVIFLFGIFLGLVIGCSVELKPRTQEDPEDLHLPDGIVARRARSMSIGSRLAEYRPESVSFLRQQSTNSKATPLTRQHSIGSKSTGLMRQNSTGSNYRPRSRSGGSRKVMREDRNVLLLHDAGMSDSTPVIARKTYL